MNREGANRFRDASGNGKTLIGMNGATTSGALAVNPARYFYNHDMGSWKSNQSPFESDTRNPKLEKNLFGGC